MSGDLIHGVVSGGRKEWGGGHESIPKVTTDPSGCHSNRNSSSSSFFFF